MKLRKDPYEKSVLAISVGLVFLHQYTGNIILLYLFFLVSILSILFPSFEIFVNKLWKGITNLLSSIVPPLILSTIYFFVLCPIAFLQRVISNNDPVKRKRSEESTFITVQKKFTKHSMENPW